METMQPVKQLTQLVRTEIMSCHRKNTM